MHELRAPFSTGPAVPVAAAHPPWTEMEVLLCWVALGWNQMSHSSPRAGTAAAPARPCAPGDKLVAPPGRSP